MTIFAPASIGNFSVGFDSLGLALDSFERQLPELLPSVLPAEELRELYPTPEEGAPTCCPMQLAGMLLLQFRYSLSERELCQRCLRDLGFRGEEFVGIGFLQQGVQLGLGQGDLGSGVGEPIRCGAALQTTVASISSTAIMSIQKTVSRSRGSVTTVRKSWRPWPTAIFSRPSFIRRRARKRA